MKDAERLRVTGSVEYEPYTNIDDILIINGDSSCRASCLFQREIYVKGNCAIGPGSKAQAIAVDGNLELGPSGHHTRRVALQGEPRIGFAFAPSASAAFNRSYPSAAPSWSGAGAIQYGEEKRYWIGGAFNGGHLAYQTISLTPYDVRFVTYGPSIFYSKWLDRRWGITFRYEYQDKVDAFQRHGIRETSSSRCPSRGPASKRTHAAHPAS